MHKHATVARTCQCVCVCVCVKRDWIAKATAAGSYVGKTPRLNSTNAQVESAGKWKVFEDGQKRVHLDALSEVLLFVLTHPHCVLEGAGVRRWNSRLNLMFTGELF